MSANLANGLRKLAGDPLLNSNSPASLRRPFAKTDSNQPQSPMEPIRDGFVIRESARLEKRGGFCRALPQVRDPL